MGKFFKLGQERQKELLTSDLEYTSILNTTSDPNSVHFDKRTEKITKADAKMAEPYPLEWGRLGNGMMLSSAKMGRLIKDDPLYVLAVQNNWETRKGWSLSTLDFILNDHDNEDTQAWSQKERKMTYA